MSGVNICARHLAEIEESAYKPVQVRKYPWNTKERCAFCKGYKARAEGLYTLRPRRKGEEEDTLRPRRKGEEEPRQSFT